MKLKTRRIAATAAAGLAVLFAVAAAGNAQAGFTSLQHDTGAVTEASYGRLGINASTGCTVKPQIKQAHNAEADRFTWKQVWVQRCDTPQTF